MLLVSEEKDIRLAERMMPFVLCNHASLGAAWDWEVAEGRGWVPLQTGLRDGTANRLHLPDDVARKEECAGGISGVRDAPCVQL